MSSKEILKKSSEVLKGKWILSIIAMYIYTTIISVPTCISSVLSSIETIIKYGEDAPEYAVYLSPFNILSILTYVVQALLVVGFVNMIFKMIKEDKVDLGCMFSGIKYWVKALGIILLTALYTLLWSLLFLVPGLVKYYSYSMALYIYAQNPEKGVKQCISESVEMMNGNKMRFFKLTLRYTLWMILAIVVSYVPFIVAVASKSLVALLIALLFMTVVLAIAISLILVHQQVAYGVFYLDLINDLYTEEQKINTVENITETIIATDNIVE